MGMRITDISLSDFRNYGHFALAGLGSLTILTGRNGVGKTNVLEAVQLATSATSFRHPQNAQLIREGADCARVQIEATDGNRHMTMSLSLAAGKRRYEVNGKAKAAADVRGVLPSVAFTPDDLQLAKKSSSVKRTALDELGAQLTRNYHVVLGDYEKTLRYKNRLLKDEAPRDLIAAIDETLVTCGSQLFCYRVALFTRMMAQVRRIYAEISGDGESFSATYLPSWDRVGDTASEAPASDRGSGALPEGPPDLSDDGTRDFAEGPGTLLGTPLDMRDNGAPDREQVRRLMYESLEEHAGEEARRHRGLVGPHNDKLTFYLDGRDASAFASQGQQRTAVLAFKLAEVALVRQSLGVNPVLLLDDVMSELDDARRDTLVNLAGEDVQTFITATDLSCFNPALLARADIVAL